MYWLSKRSIKGVIAWCEGGIGTSSISFQIVRVKEAIKVEFKKLQWKFKGKFDISLKWITINWWLDLKRDWPSLKRYRKGVKT